MIHKHRHHKSIQQHCVKIWVGVNRTFLGFFVEWLWSTFFGLVWSFEGNSDSSSDKSMVTSTYWAFFAKGVKVYSDSSTDEPVLRLGVKVSSVSDGFVVSSKGWFLHMSRIGAVADSTTEGSSSLTGDCYPLTTEVDVDTKPSSDRSLVTTRVRLHHKGQKLR